ncbi:MAG: NADP-dependent oxidoreductase [Polyangia bacterium]
MKTMQIETFGGPDVLHAADAPDPSPTKGQVRVRVRSVGVNPFESKVRAGVMEQVFKTPLPAILGNELSGIVDAVGEGVTILSVGEEVFGWSDTGAYAELALASIVTKKPAAVSWDLAASLPVAYETAHRVLDLLSVKAGDTVLIHGGSGVVGSVGIQLALIRRAKVVATGSAENQDFIASLGATPIVYGAGLLDRMRALALPTHPGAPYGVDAVFDAVGKGALPDSITIRGGTTRIVTIADMAAQSLGITFSSGTASDRSVPLLEEAGMLAADGKLRVDIAAKFPLADAAKAQALGDGKHAPGKILLGIG